MMVAWAQVVTLEVMRNRILDIVEGGAKRICCWNGCGMRETEQSCVTPRFLTCVWKDIN